MSPTSNANGNTAVLLLAHGTPNRLSEMAEYLSKVTGGRPMPQHVVEELQHRYAEIGLREDPLPAGPPLTRWTLRQGDLLSEAIAQPVYVGMRNWHPYITDVVARMKADGITHAKVLCLAPQNSRTSTGLYRRALEAALSARPRRPASRSPTTSPPAGRTNPSSRRPSPNASSPPGPKPAPRQGRRVPVLFTAHSVPCRTIRATTPDEATARPGAPVPAEGIQNYGPAREGDPYPVECKQTAAAVARLMAPLGMTEADWVFAFQSQGVAGAPWIGPSVEDTLKSLAEAGHKAVVMQPIGFLCDHVEILYDIDVNFRDFGQTLGLEVTRAESLNDSPTLIRAIEHVLSTRSGATELPSAPRASSTAELRTTPLPEPALAEASA